MMQLSLREAASVARIDFDLPLEIMHPTATAEPMRQPDTFAETAGWWLVGLGAICVCLMFWVHSLGSRDCRSQPIPLVLGFDTETSIAVPSDSPCTILFSAGSSTLDELSVSAQPANGTVVARGRTGVIYRPHQKFKGEDSFAFSVRGGASAMAQTSTVRVNTVIR